MSSDFKNVKAAQAEVQVDQTFLNMHAKKLVKVSRIGNHLFYRNFLSRFAIKTVLPKNRLLIMRIVYINRDNFKHE